MIADQIGEAARLGGLAAGGIVGSVEHVHRTVAKRAFRPTAPASVPVRVVHDSIASLVYRALRGAFVVGGSAAGAASRFAISHLELPDAGSTTAGNHVLSVVNAIIGDQLAAESSPLAITMAVRAGGRDVAPTAEELAEAYPAATSRLAVFVHGLGENDDTWRIGAGGDTYGSRLEAEFGCSPVYVRYNTGRHISTNGRALAALLADVVGNWPVEVDEVLLIGHSMGGLVIRSACHYGVERADPWVRHVHHVVYLGSPHGGALLARGVRSLSWVLDLLPEARPYGAVLDHSPGIRDLRYGYLLDDDWARCDAGSCRRDHSRDVPLLASANHYAVSASIGAGPASRVVGDLLVHPASARGRARGRHIPFVAEHSRHYSGLHHFSLLNHPAVYAAVRDWIVSEAEPVRT